MGMRAQQLRNPFNQRHEDSIIQIMREQTTRDIMEKRLHDMTPVIDTSGPKALTLKHLELRLKKIQIADDRKQEIARDNRKLMDKMTQIIKGKGKPPLYTPAFQLSRSLNERERKEYVQRVNHDNKVMLKRLQSQTPTIKIAKMEDDFQRWMENRKICSKAYKRQQRARMVETRRRRMEQLHQLTPSRLIPQRQGNSSNSCRSSNNSNYGDGMTSSIGAGSTVAEVSGNEAMGAVSMYRTAKQIKEDLIREGKSFVPLPSLVQVPSANTQPQFIYSEQDNGVTNVGGAKVAFGIQHRGTAEPSNTNENSRGVGPGESLDRCKESNP